jgi:hypothetical protein
MVVDEWRPFGWSLMQSLKPSPGVYELADKDEVTIYIGGAENLRSCFERLLAGPDPLCMKKHVETCRIEYREDYRSQVQFLLNLFKSTYGKEPLCNNKGHSGSWLKLKYEAGNGNSRRRHLGRVLEVTHSELRRKYAGEWVCANRNTGKPIAHGKSLSDVIDQARSKDLDVPRVYFKLPSTNDINLQD